MSSEQRITDFLIKNVGKPYCDDCLSQGLQIKTRQQVQQKTSKLGKQSDFSRAPGRCARCHSDKIVVQATFGKAHVASREATSGLPRATVVTRSRPPVTAGKVILTGAEESHCKIIETKDRELRAFLDSNRFVEPMDARQWLTYLTGVKHILGNMNNDVSFLATLLVKEYLERRFAVTNFDAGAKAQGAPGIDVEARTMDGRLIMGELKTTKPYQPGFGAAQRAAIEKDLGRLAATVADHRFMFVVDVGTFEVLSRKNFTSKAPGIEVVNLVTGEAFVCPGGE